MASTKCVIYKFEACYQNLQVSRQSSPESIPCFPAGPEGALGTRKSSLTIFPDFPWNETTLLL